MGSAFTLLGQTQNDMADLLLSLPAREYSAERDYGPFRSVVHPDSALAVESPPLRSSELA